MSCSTPRVKVCSPGIPLVISVGTVKLDVCVNCSNSHVNRVISAACLKTEPSENQILAFPSVLTPAGTSRCSSSMFKPKVCVLTGGVEFMWSVFNSSSFGKMHFLLGLGSSDSALRLPWSCRRADPHHSATAETKFQWVTCETRGTRDPF